jgi:hypothetical protein
MAALKKFWHTVSTGWVVEYPGRSNNGPRDFFDRRSDGPRQSQQLPPYQEQGWDQRKEEEEREDAIAKWSEQIRMRDSQGSRPQSSVGTRN